MHYVKQFDVNGVATKQVACIELHGKPNAATEGAVGVLGIDMDSPLHDVYKCVGVNGSIYSWDLLSSGLSIMSATISGGGIEAVEFPYAKLKTPAMYVVKVGDLILDSEGYLYQIDALNTTFCAATYCGTQVVAYGMSAYTLAVKNGFEGSEEEWLSSLKGDKGEPGAIPYIGENGTWWVDGVDTHVKAHGCDIATGTYQGTNAWRDGVTLYFDFKPLAVYVIGGTKFGLFVNGTGISAQSGSAFGSTNTTWDDNSLKFVAESVYYSLNESGVTYSYIAFGKSNGGSGGGDTSIVTFNIEGHSFTVVEGTTWIDWAVEEGMDYVYPSGGQIKSPWDDAPLLDTSGNPVLENDIIVSGEYGFASTTMVEFEIQDEVADTRYYSVEDGTTWGEWAETTYDDDIGEVEWSADSEGYIRNRFSGGFLADMDGNPVMSWDSIISSPYQRMP